MSNCFDPDRARRSVGPDLGQNCFQTSLADDKIPQADKELKIVIGKDYLSSS